MPPQPRYHRRDHRRSLLARAMPALRAGCSLLPTQDARHRRRPPIRRMTVRAHHQVLGEGRDAQTLAWSEGQVLRLLKNPTGADRLARERGALPIARAGGVPGPRGFGPLTLDGRPGYLLERIDGPTALDVLRRQPWRLPQIARMLGTTHAAIHTALAGHELPSVHDRIRQAISETPELTDPLRHLAIQQLEGLDGGDALCHWDFQPANVTP